MNGIGATLVFVLLSSASGNAKTTESPSETIRGPIFISEPPNSLEFGNTKGAAVPCNAFGRPAPVLDWKREDGTPVDNIPGILEILPNNTLFFHPFDAGDFREPVHSQTYRCIAGNSAGTIVSRTMHVKAVVVEDYKTYNLKADNEWSSVGNTAVFRCSINPYFVKDYVKVISWTQGTKTLNPGADDRVSILADGDLHIRDIRDGDRFTTYRCVANNTLTGETKSSTPAYLYVHVPPAGGKAPAMEDFSRSMIVKKGDTVELPCVASSKPSPKYRWQKNGESIVIDNEHFLQKGGNLLVKSASVEDSGHYMCNASNDHGSTTVITELTVTSPLSANIDPAMQIVDSGQTALFNCSVTGYPITSIQWYKDGDLLNIRDERITVQSETVLEITDVQRTDQGMYQCILSNTQSSYQGTSQLLLGAAHPALVEKFVDQYVQNGQRTLLRCKAAGNPTPKMTWTLDGDVVPIDALVHVGSIVDSLGFVTSYVNISSIQIKYGGEYKCSASNDVGTVSHVGSINVYGIPYVRKLKNITATAGEQLSIRCYVAGYPVKSITWYKDGLMLPRNHLQKVINGTLTIDKVQKSQDFGQYTCAARNGDGQGDSSNMFITVLEPPVIDPFQFPRRKQGDRVVVSCVVSSGDQPLVIKWTKDGEDIPPDMGITVQKMGSYSSMLSIGNAMPKHNGKYTCHAHNAAADVNFTAPLHVDVPPRWIIEPQDSYVILNGVVMLDCQTAGTPDPEVAWNKAQGDQPGNYKMLEYEKSDGTSSSRLQLLSNGTLIIKKATEADHGYYLCHSTNGVGVGLSKLIFLTVHIPARFDGSMKNYTVLKGSNITMDCQAIGDKPLSVTWSFNGQSVSMLRSQRREMETRVTTRGKLSYLRLTPSVRNDTGIYVCHAKNKFGNGALSMRLTVIEPPEAPINLTYSKVTSRNVTLSWMTPYNGNSALRHYIIEYKNQTDVWQGVLPNVTVAASHLAVTIKRLHPAFTYKIRVRANNSVGYGPPSAEVIVTMDEEKPTGPPTEVQVKAIGSEALRISWMPPQKQDKNGLILGYYIGYRETNSPSRFIYITKAVKGEFKPMLDIRNLEKFTKYTVHIQAYNKRGRGPPSQDYHVFTLEDVPSQPPQGVQANSINSQSIKVVWSPPPLFTLHGILQGYRVHYKPVRKDEDESDANTLTSSQLEITINRLSKYTNYSVQVLAYTRKGEGVRSPPLYIRTQEDVPDKPADIKALPVNTSTLLVSWKTPRHSNGILTKYNLYIRNATETQDEVLELPASKTTYLMTHLDLNARYSFQVSAATRIGEGEKTNVTTASPLERAIARIASFSDVLTIPWQHSLTLPCMAVGDPSPSLKWKIRGQAISHNERVRILQNGSLHITKVVGGDAANYTCEASNIYGSDTITFAISVQAPPKPPKMYVAATTTSTIQVNWRTGSNGGSPIQGFDMQYRKDHEAWRKVKLTASNRTYTASALLCGTQYKFYISAHNSLGTSVNSRTIEVKTNGSVPIMPAQSNILKSINTTSVDLDMLTWATAGCPIRFFSVKYQVWGDDKWVEVSNSINRNITTFTVLDLHPATWYIMVVTAHSDAGSTDSRLKFATLTFHGVTIMPIYVARKMETHFYEKAYIIIPMCAGIVALFVLVVGVLLYCKRRREMIHIKENASNLRRDITAETSLMNDLDKRLNLDLDSSSGNSEPFGKRNVNLLISLHSDDNFDNLNGNSQSWLIHDSSKTNSDNGSFGRSDDDGNINPYATFNQLKQVLAEKHDCHRNNEMMPEFDDISLEKAQAQKCMSSPSEPYVPFFHKDETTDPNPPLVPMRDASQKTEGYDNQGMILSPRKYASADQIHALFTQGPPRPHSYGKSKSGSHGSSDEKGSQRHSVISSVTTVSSSRDELLEALENARKNPPPPVVYEPQQDSSSQPTDSSGGTEPGIVQFTQSPPKPNEQRQAACEVPGYEGKTQKRPVKKKEQESSTDHETEPPQTLHPRRTRGRHRGKQRGHIAKRQVIPTFVPRAHSRTSTTSSEEVTYTFGSRGGATERDSPHSNSPTEGGYLTFRKDGKGFPEKDRGQRKNPKVGRGTPHVRMRYDMSLQTPGTDEHRPLVMSLAGQSMTSPAEEDEDAVSLLDRYYRPVPDEESNDNSSRKKKGDKGYTDDFTVV